MNHQKLRRFFTKKVKVSGAHQINQSDLRAKSKAILFSRLDLRKRLRENVSRGMAPSLSNFRPETLGFSSKM